MLASSLSSMVVTLPSAVVGGLVASRRPTNVVGWLFLGGAACLALQEIAYEYSAYGLLTEPGALPFAQMMAWVAVWTGPLSAILIFVILPFYFPDGRLVSSRWRPVVWLVVSAGAVELVLYSLIPSEAYETGIANPLGVEALQPYLGIIQDLGLALWLGLILVAVVSLVVRFLRSRGEERQQLKWFTYAVSIMLIWFCTNWPISAAMPDLFLVLDSLVISGVPVAVGIAVLRYRLYDIDVVINRTLVYGSLTVILTAVYFGGVATTQTILHTLTGQEELPQLAIVASTLAIAALFSPLRRRIQSFIDRRFYRNKYDATKTLEVFSSRLRDETDLEALSDDLVGVVRETMQPTHVSLWMRTDTAVQSNAAGKPRPWRKHSPTPPTI